MCHWTLDPVDRDATLANKALHRTPPDCRVLIEIACIRSPEDLLTVKRAYCSLYNHSLEEDVASRTTGDIRKGLMCDPTNEYLTALHTVIECIQDPKKHYVKERQWS
ncbi:annexin D8-like [Tripterygium wilfordii]|uniref:Annexin D8-like n=1 Tax=Tripterygium wilfordii TaxID=458696 RepID=A0A7J7C1F2_TRIWF|nr:annexin D8-like [Tripterygium wilfordii]